MLSVIFLSNSPFVFWPLCILADLLQRPEDGHNRLKRVILIGDHHQLPPVVKNIAIQKYSHLDQSLFTRFIRLGTPYIELNAQVNWNQMPATLVPLISYRALLTGQHRSSYKTMAIPYGLLVFWLQGRARPSIAKLYNWRYNQLGDLPGVMQHPRFQVANAGFAMDFQFIDVQDFHGRGESQPIPYFYQVFTTAQLPAHWHCLDTVLQTSAVCRNRCLVWSPVLTIHSPLGTLWHLMRPYN